MARFFHGGSRPFREFDMVRRGSGSEPNSVLGIWLTFVPNVAADYGIARGNIDSAVMVVDTIAEDRPLRLAFCGNRDIAIYGVEDAHQDWVGDTDQQAEARQKFERARNVLMAHGIDGIWCGDGAEGTDLEGAVVLFDSTRIEISHVISDPEILRQVREFEDIEDEDVCEILGGAIEGEHEDDGVEYVWEWGLAEVLEDLDGLEAELTQRGEVEFAPEDIPDIEDF